MPKTRDKKTIAEIRQEIVEFVNHSNDKHILKIISQIIDPQKGDEEIHIFSWEQHQRVKRGLEDIKHGRVLSNEEVNRQTEEWLEKK